LVNIIVEKNDFYSQTKITTTTTTIIIIGTRLKRPLFDGINVRMTKTFTNGVDERRVRFIILKTTTTTNNKQTNNNIIFSVLIL
jgi:hypothetical protein